jgi:hypothetical protein
LLAGGLVVSSVPFYSLATYLVEEEDKRNDLPSQNITTRSRGRTHDCPADVLGSEQVHPPCLTHGIALVHGVFHRLDLEAGHASRTVTSWTNTVERA